MFFRILILALIFSSSAYGEDVMQYIVKPHDVLLRVLKAHNKHAPLFGERGSLQRAIELNPSLVAKHGDLIFPGNSLLIPTDMLVAAPAEERLAEQTKPANRLPAEADTETPSTVAAETTDVTTDVTADAAAKAADAPAKVVGNKVADDKEAVKITTPSPVAKLAAQEIEPYSSAKVEAGFSYSSIVGFQPSNSSSGRLLSDGIPSVKVSWEQNWTKDLQSSIAVSARTIRFQSEVTGIRIDNASGTDLGFGLGLQTKFASRFVGSMVAEYQPTLFYHGLVGGGIMIDHVPLLRLHPKLGFQVLEIRPFSLIADAGYSAWLPSTFSNFSIETGTGYDIGLSLSQKSASGSFRCGVGYEQRKQSTSFLNLTETQVGVNCGLERDFQ